MLFKMGVVMKSLESICAHLEEAVEAHSRVDGTAVFKKLTRSLANWRDKEKERVSGGAPAAGSSESVDPDTRRYRLFLILIEAALSEDSLTNLVAHKLLGDCFSHAEIVNYLENRTGLFISKFQSVYHPTKSYVQQVDDALPASAARFSSASVFRSPDLCREVYAHLDSSQLMQMRLVDSFSQRAATQIIFSRTDEQSQQYQIKLLRGWLSSKSAWERFEKLFLLDKAIKNNFIDCLKKQILHLSESNRKHFLLFRFALAKINKEEPAADEALVISLIEECRSTSDDEWWKAFPKELERISVLFSEDVREKLITILRDCAATAGEYSDIRPLCVRFIGEICFYSDQISDEIIDFFLEQVACDLWQIHAAVVDTFTLLLPKLTDAQVNGLLTRVERIHLGEERLIPNGFLTVLGAISSQLPQQDIERLVNRLASHCLPERNKDILSLESIDNCLYHLLKHSVAEPSEKVLSALVTRLLAPDVDFEAAASDLLRLAMRKSGYRNWFSFAHSLLQSSQEQELTFHRFSHTCQSYGLDMFPAAMLNRLEKYIESPDAEQAFNALYSMGSMAFHRVPDALARQLIEQAYSSRQFGYGQEARGALFKVIRSLIPFLSGVSMELLYQEVQTVLVSPPVEPQGGYGEDDFRRLCIFFSSIRLLADMAPFLAAVRLAEAIELLIAGAEAGDISDDDDVEMFVASLVALYSQMSALPDVLLNRLVGDQSIAPIAPGILEMLSDKLTVTQVGSLVDRLYTTLTGRTVASQDKVHAGALLVSLAAVMDQSAFAKVKGTLASLSTDSAEVEVRQFAQYTLAMIYIKSLDCGDESLEATLHALSSRLTTEQEGLAYGYLYARLSSLTASQLKTIEDAANGPLKNSLKFLTFQQVAKEVHAALSYTPADSSPGPGVSPGLGGGGGAK